MAANHLSDYANNLDPYVKKRYYEKISSVGIGPILIPDKAYDPDCLNHFQCLRQVPTARIKAFRSLQAYSQPVSGFLSRVKGHKIGNNYIVLGKVRHSKRINDPCVTL